MFKLNKYLLLGCLVSSTVGMSQDLYDISNITEIDITFSDASWDATMDTYYANDLDELLYGSCTINGISYDSVGVAYKGNSTYNANNAKNPIKIKLSEIYGFQNHQGYETIKLSNGNKDPSFVREVLSYEIGRQYMDMPLSNYAKVTINGSYYGLFSSSESINGDFMEKRFYCDDDNTRIKCNPEYGVGSSSLEYLGADSSLYYSSYEMKSDFGWAELIDLCYQIENNAFTLEQYLDVDAAIWMLAFDNVLVNLDSYIGPLKQNYYLIQDDNGRIHPVIWDLNQSFASFTMLGAPSGGGPPQPTTLSDFTDLDLFFQSTDITYPLIYFLLSNPRYKKMYVAHAKTILEENFSNSWYYSRAQELQTIIDAEVQAEPNGFYNYNQFINNLDTQQGSGMGGGTYGISELMESRLIYLQSLASFNYTDPTISNVTSSSNNPTANSTVTITADIADANYAYLGYRFYEADAFQKIEMFDDGAHNDGAPGDGTYGADVTIGASDMQYYIYAENNEAGKFSPVRAEHEFYELTLSSGVVVNEIMPSNIVTVADQDGEFDDWIEFYNNSSSSVDMSGYFLSDDITIYNKWIFPSGTTIPANGYLIVWCDNDILQSGLHTGFKLTSKGETVLLSDASGNPINEVTFPKMQDNLTYGRYPNGTGGFIPMVPTYNASNSFSSIGLDEELETFEVQFYPNPAENDFMITLGTNEQSQLELFDLTGRLVKQELIISNAQINIANLKPGTYILRIASENWTGKLIKR